MIAVDFFVGIGDINSAFLPKLQPLAPDISSPEVQTPSKTPAPPPPPPVTAAPDRDMTIELVSDSAGPSPEEEEMEEMRKSEILARNAAGLDAQVEARPLAKMAEELREKEEEEEKAHMQEQQEEGASQKDGSGGGEEGQAAGLGEGGGETNGKPSLSQVNGSGTTTPRSTTPKPEKHVRKALLKNDDVELYRVQKVGCCGSSRRGATNLLFTGPRSGASELLWCIRQETARREKYAQEAVKGPPLRRAGEFVSRAPDPRPPNAWTLV